mmetsp:Transcript_28039/g.61866  ORF Transcript_28039/g.61866 Transcript_28039/m.61866 type:complete len:257 (+) Transcript_28039:254-1024(+)
MRSYHGCREQYRQGCGKHLRGPRRRSRPKTTGRGGPSTKPARGGRKQGRIPEGHRRPRPVPHLARCQQAGGCRTDHNPEPRRDLQRGIRAGRKGTRRRCRLCSEGRPGRLRPSRGHNGHERRWFPFRGGGPQKAPHPGRRGLGSAGRTPAAAGGRRLRRSGTKTEPRRRFQKETKSPPGGYYQRRGHGRTEGQGNQEGSGNPYRQNCEHCHRHGGCIQTETQECVGRFQCGTTVHGRPGTSQKGPGKEEKCVPRNH